MATKPKNAFYGILQEHCVNKQHFDKVSLIILNCRPKARNFIKKETLAQVFSCEFHEMINLLCRIIRSVAIYNV